jgi:hypothetical protein
MTKRLMIGGILLSNLVDAEQIPFLQFAEFSIDYVKLMPACCTYAVCIHIVQNFSTLCTTNDTDSKRSLASRSTLNFPNVSLQETFLLVSVVNWMILFRT